MSRGSLEENVDPSQMYSYFMDQSVAQSKKAEGQRGQLNKVLEMNKQMREYDLKSIKRQELEDMNMNIQKLKDNWADLKGFLKKQVDVLEDVKERHEEDVENYKQFVDYIEPSSLKEKL